MGIESAYQYIKVLQGKGVAPSPRFNWSQMEPECRQKREWRSRLRLKQLDLSCRGMPPPAFYHAEFVFARICIFLD